MNEKKFFAEILKDLVMKLFDLEKKKQESKDGQDNNLYRTAQELFAEGGEETKAMGKRKVDYTGGSVTMDKDQPTFDTRNINMGEKDMDFEGFMDIVGDIEDMLEHKQNAKDFDLEAKKPLLKKCQCYFVSWILYRLEQEAEDKE